MASHINKSRSAQNKVSQIQLATIWKINRGNVLGSLNVYRSDISKSIRELAIAKWKGAIPNEIFAQSVWLRFLQSMGIPDNELQHYERVTAFAVFIVCYLKSFVNVIDIQ